MRHQKRSHHYAVDPGWWAGLMPIGERFEQFGLVLTCQMMYHGRWYGLERSPEKVVMQNRERNGKSRIIPAPAILPIIVPY
jgi:hypothetical protein